MKRLANVLRPPWFYAALGVVIVVGRFLATVGQSAQRFPDSIGYDTFSLLSTSDRPGPISFLFSIAGTDTTRMTLHVVLGSVSWLYLVYALTRRSKFPRAFAGITVIVGLTPQVIRYDVTILSESLSISFAVFAVAATFHYVVSPTRTVRYIWLTSIAVCALSRPAHIIIPIVCVLPYLWSFVKSRGRSIAPAGLVLLIIVGFAGFQLRNSAHMSTLNMYTVMSTRVLSDDARFQWFVDNGFPATSEMRTATGYDFAEQLPDEINAIVDLPVGQQPPSLMRVGGVPVAQWIRDSGLRTLARYLITHPTDTLQHAHMLMSPTLNPPNDDFLPLTNGPMIPRFFFFSWQVWISLWALCATVALLSRTTRRHGVSLLAAGVIIALIYVATVHTSGIEHMRHVSVVAVVLRVVGLMALAGIFQLRTPQVDTDASISA